ncbi:MAG: flavodoxin-dependent (E)-4-hydroxy-3-methylbut-2-enyl-diphosphate synthase, partial [Kiritimatiellae bacterium]|nr:flavodoxin-dependent (E)-4-hydroxy-3-methylbut-2-enyl-diphosphate synthase [Kiritimatiellia bacterium]
MFRREETRTVHVGAVPVGGGAPVSVQTMCNLPPHDAGAILAQAQGVARLGCDIFRLTVPDIEAAKALGKARSASPIPFVADIHFDYRCALAAIEAGADALRLNPGNIGAAENVRAVARAALARKIPIRIGVNMGSLEKPLAAKARGGEISPAGCSIRFLPSARLPCPVSAPSGPSRDSCTL